MASVQWHALANEAEFAAEHLAIGATSLSKANFAHRAYYYQTFFSLTIGIERTCKLALLVDHALKSSGSFPNEQSVRSFGHNLQSLLESVESIGISRAAQYGLPSTPIHAEIIRILSTFATNVTRYYNIDLLTGKPSLPPDPVADWYDNVVMPCYDKFVSKRLKDAAQHHSDIFGDIFETVISVNHTDEHGSDVTSYSEMSKKTAIWQTSSPFVRLHVLQFARFLSGVMRELTYATYTAQFDMPHFSEFFAIFDNSDQLLKSRKTWSIH